MKLNKNQAMIDYLITCPAIKENPLFFNFTEARDNISQFVTDGNEKTLDKPYIDGSVEKLYTFNMIIYKSVVYNPVVKVPGFQNENIADFQEVQEVIDWITKQNELENYPDFGKDALIDSIAAMNQNPTLNGVDSSVSPPLAKYSMAIEVKFLDKSGMIWK